MFMKRKCNYIVAVLSMALLSACGPSKYTALSDTWNKAYGYEDTPLDETTYQVTYHGDASLNAATVDRYALFRCAELTVEKGYDYFVVMDGTAQTGSISVPGSHQTHIEHDIDPQSGKFVPVAVTTTNMTSFQTVLKSKTIRLFKGSRPGDNPNAYDARSMVKVMGTTIER
jgi:hypothetical protein